MKGIRVIATAVTLLIGTAPLSIAHAGPEDCARQYSAEMDNCARGDSGCAAVATANYNDCMSREQIIYQ